MGWYKAISLFRAYMESARAWALERLLFTCMISEDTLLAYMNKRT
jgi:hypothetical protein